MASGATELTREGLPTGTVTFLFTDIEGSTRMLERLGDDYRQVEEGRDMVMEEALAYARKGG